MSFHTSLHALLGALLTSSLLHAGAAMAQAPTGGTEGKALFAKNCAACHQADGRGIPGAFPALAGSAVALGEPAPLAAVLLKGRGGMPAFSGSLDDAEIAAVLSHVRSSWGNGAAPVSSAEIEAQRSALQVAPATRSRFGNKH
ncbi:cytochrome c [Massilia sp. IC2-477]|uniref:c-type cytochrome n=1 Tax=Massilia sp. IC2-477 TaxID=2887198 RepID=UPI001D10B68D|nr:cytochrome c [Massilia sp. IC2-477]MCC2955737.1 cytochrome c [Massilia sp. IC2-477]